MITPYQDRLPDFVPKPAKVSEGAVVNACIRWLFMHGCFVWRNNTGAHKAEHGGYVRYGLKGSADIIGMNPSGRFIGIECKAGKNKQSDEQIAFQRNVEEKGGLYILAYGLDDLESRKAEITGMSYGA